MEYLKSLYNQLDTPLFNKIIKYRKYSDICNLNQEDINRLKTLDLLIADIEYESNNITDLKIEGRSDAEILRIAKSLVKSKGIGHIIETLIKNKKDHIVPQLFEN